jgi:hypothetical protein
MFAHIDGFDGPERAEADVEGDELVPDAGRVKAPEKFVGEVEAGGRGGD